MAFDFKKEYKQFYLPKNKPEIVTVPPMNYIAVRDAGFEILEARECFRPIRFFDVGALVWFARIIEWEFPGFSVDTCRDRLLNAQRILEQNGCIEGKIHRFLLAAGK